MPYGLNSLRAKVRRVLKDPIANVVLNYSVDKAKEYYDKAVIQWEQGDYQGGEKVDVHEEVSFAFFDLENASKVAMEAHNLYTNMKNDNKPYIRKLDWYLYGQNFIVSWHRMKTFDEYLHDGIGHALEKAYRNAEDGARLVLERELGIGTVSNQDIHCFAEGIIDAETLERLSKFEPTTKFEGKDKEMDIKKCIVELNARRAERKKEEEKKEAEEVPEVVQKIMDLVSKYYKNGDAS